MDTACNYAKLQTDRTHNILADVGALLLHLFGFMQSELNKLEMVKFPISRSISY